MTRIYLVRHGQTLFNVKHRIQGWCDSPLTDQGIKQAKDLGKALASISFEEIYSSTSERASDTAFLITGRVPTKLKALKEISFGKMEGENREALYGNGQFYPDGYEQFGGESKATARNRFLLALEDIKKAHPTGNVLIVSHGSILREVLSYLDEGFRDDQGDTAQMVPNCSVSIIEDDHVIQRPLILNVHDQ